MSKDDRIVVYQDMTVTPGQPCPHPSHQSAGPDAPSICDICGAIGERVKLGKRYGYHWPNRNVPDDVESLAEVHLIDIDSRSTPSALMETPSMPRRHADATSASTTVAATVRALRRQRGLTLADLADRLTRLNHPITLNTLSKLETGARRITVDDLVALAAALDVTPHDLLRFDLTVSFT